MSINDICLNIPYNISEILGHNQSIYLNRTISIIDGWLPPLVFNINTDRGPLCGPVVKIVEQVSKRLGST